MQPLALQIGPMPGFAGTVVPITGIPHIAFLPMKVGVHPGGIGSLIILNEMMRFFPIALRGQP